jgi:hypothetical protein
MIISCYDWVCYDHKIESNENRAIAILKQTDFSKGHKIYLEIGKKSKNGKEKFEHKNEIFEFS